MVASAPDLPSPRPASERAATFVVTLMAIGETSVGMLLLAFPRELVLLLIDATLDVRGVIVARMLGVAVLALGITWWMGRRDVERLSRYAAGFIVYNVGVGLLFGWAAPAARHPVLTWTVCAIHLAAGVGFGVFVRRNPAQEIGR
jgi:hypothetical protein